MGRSIVNFETALSALRERKRISRISWNDKSIFVFMQIPALIKKDVVPNMQSLPQSVKDEFQKRFDDPSEQIDAIYYCDQLAIVYSSNLIKGYSPSASDVLAEDWIILD